MSVLQKTYKGDKMKNWISLILEIIVVFASALVIFFYPADSCIKILSGFGCICIIEKIKEIAE